MKLKGFYSTLFAIAIPITLQNLLQTFVNMLDTVMIGQLGSYELASVGLGNQIFFVLNMILFGITSGGSVFIAQFWGKKDYNKIQKSLGIMLFLSFAVAFIFTILCFVIPERIIRIYSPDPIVIETGSIYLQTVCISYIPTALSIAFTQAFRSTEHVKLPLYSTAISLFTNAVLNYFLIFTAGLGVEGAAIATIISRFLEFFILVSWSYSHKFEACGTYTTFFNFDRSFVAKFIRIAFPVIINESFWGLGISAQNAIFAHAGTDAFTAFNITGTISQLTWVLCIGLGNGISVIIGKLIGQNEKNLAIAYANRASCFIPLCGAIVGLFLLPLSLTLPIFFKVEPEILNTAKKMLLVLMFIYPCNAFCMNWVVGICRAGGDTTFSAIAEIVVLWGIAIPLGCLTAFVLKLSPVLIYISLMSESVIKVFIGLYRVLSRKWLHDVTK